MSSGWIEHKGSDCPVDPMVNVEYELFGDPNIYYDRAGSLFWGHPLPGDPGRIARYRTLA